MFITGHNMPGCLPESTVSEAETFEGAKAALLHELRFLADYAMTESEAEDFSNAAADVSLWLTPCSISVGTYVYWIEAA